MIKGVKAYVHLGQTYFFVLFVCVSVAKVLILSEARIEYRKRKF